MNLQEILGDGFREDMSIEEINNALSGKKLADLSTGNYIDKNKYDREVADLNKRLSEQTTQLQNKLSDDEKAAAKDKETAQLIADLQKQVKTQNEEINRSKAIAGFADAKGVLGIKDTDTEYTDFVNNLAGIDGTVSNGLVSYVNKAIKAAYDKGKSDAVKNGLGDMGKQITGSTGKGENNFGKELAKATQMKTTDYDYFSQFKQ